MMTLNELRAALVGRPVTAWVAHDGQGYGRPDTS